MDRGTWRAIVHGVARVRHDLVATPPPPPYRRVTVYVEDHLGFLVNKAEVFQWYQVLMVAGTC